ncbi:MAG: cytochrome c biogenesis protein CcsA [Firmicutes bacterium]|nr:cytochrome c biogenesis protein CcsA [Bacillota bacterium]
MSADNGSPGDPLLESPLGSPLGSPPESRPGSPLESLPGPSPGSPPGSPSKAGSSRAGSSRWTLLLGTAACLAMLAALYAALLFAPPERHMGDVQRIFYLHVNLAWTGYLAFAVTAVTSGLYLGTGRRSWDRIARASAEVGLLLITLVILSGSLWARPVWNTWWTDDPRLTTTLILWFLYAGYLLLHGTGEGPGGTRAAAAFGIVAFVMVPIVHMSVFWWRSLHPLVVTPGRMALEPRMVTALLVAAPAFALLYAWLLWQRVRLLRLEDEVAVLKGAVTRRYNR